MIDIYIVTPENYPVIEENVGDKEYVVDQKGSSVLKDIKMRIIQDNVGNVYTKFDTNGKILNVIPPNPALKCTPVKDIPQLTIQSKQDLEQLLNPR